MVAFKPMKPDVKSDGNGGYVWKGDVDKFQGYVAAKLENIHESMRRLENAQKACDVKVDANTVAISTIKTKVAMIGAGVSVLVTAGLSLVSWLGGRIL